MHHPPHHGPGMHHPPHHGPGMHHPPHHGPGMHHPPHGPGMHHERRMQKWAKFNRLWGEVSVEATTSNSSVGATSTVENTLAPQATKNCDIEAENAIILETMRRSLEDKIEFPAKESDMQGKPCARFVRDVTFPDGSSVVPCSIIQKSWKIRNDGNLAWPETTCISSAGGDFLNFSPDNQLIGSVLPNHEIDITVQLMAPKELGRYLSYFRLRKAPNEPFFGQRVWIDIRVIDDEDERIWVNVPNTDISPVKSSFVEERSVEVDHQVEQSITETVTVEELNFYKRELETLSDMGFKDFNITLPLLKEYISEPASNKPNDVRHAQDMQKVVANLLSSASRHSSS